MRRIALLLIVATSLTFAAMPADATDRSSWSAAKEVSTWDGFGAGTPEIRAARHITLNPANGSYYVVDGQNNVFEFDGTGNARAYWPLNPPSLGPSTYDIAASTDGRLFFSRTDSQFTPTHVEVFSATGVELAKWTADVGRAIDIDQERNELYTAHDDQVVVYDLNGRLLRTIGSPGRGGGQLEDVNTLGWSSATQRLYVSDDKGIQMFSRSGQWLGLWEDNYWWPKAAFDIQFDSAGNVLLERYENFFFHSADGELLDRFETPRTMWDSYLDPSGQLLRTSSSDYVHTWSIALCAGRPATIVGSAQDDRIVGTTGDDVISGLGGSDVIRGMDGNDTICGGDGRDVLFGGFGNDTILGGRMNDILKGDHGHDVLFGEKGNDRVFGGPGKDRLIGGAGDRDVLNGRGGRDSCSDRQPQTTRLDCEAS